MDPRAARRENVHFLRDHPSPPEELAWEVLRKRRLLGLKFRRQHGIGPFVLDFYCPERKLVLEIDGICHLDGDRAERDRNRDAWLQERGLKILRLPAVGLNEEVIKSAIERTMEPRDSRPA
jgi:very-short-patch-repair endonuclease